jgi:hypothetical protein
MGTMARNADGEIDTDGDLDDDLKKTREEGT